MTPQPKLRLTTEALDALKRLAAKFPEWSEAQLGSKLLHESVLAALGERGMELPTLHYIRGQVAPEEARSAVVTEARLADVLRFYNAVAPPESTARVAEDPPVPRSAHARRAGK